MTKVEFMSRPSDFGFTLNPLDVDLINMQYELVARMKNEAPTDEGYNTIVEEFVSKNPERTYGRILIAIRKGEWHHEQKYEVVMNVYNKPGNFMMSSILYEGTWERVCQFVASSPNSSKFKWDFFSKSKANALWLHECMEEYMEQIDWDNLDVDDNVKMQIIYCQEFGKVNDQVVAGILQATLSKAEVIEFSMPDDLEQKRVRMNQLLSHVDIDLKVTRYFPGYNDLDFHDDAMMVLTETPEEGKPIDAPYQLMVCWQQDMDWNVMTKCVLPILQTILNNGGLTHDKKVLRQISVNDDVEILGHVFHGLHDIKEHVEMSLYKSYAKGEASQWEPRKKGDVHVGEMWMPYPCFDSEDFVNENRSYSNFIFRNRPLTQDDMRRLSELPSGKCECRITDNVPDDMLPLVYYFGEGDTMQLLELRGDR